MEHWRKDGLYQGYYCMICGAPGLNMFGMSTDHGPNKPPCTPNPELVKELIELNKADENGKK